MRLALLTDPDSHADGAEDTGHEFSTRKYSHHSAVANLLRWLDTEAEATTSVRYDQALMRIHFCHPLCFLTGRFCLNMALRRALSRPPQRAMSCMRAQVMLTISYVSLTQPKNEVKWRNERAFSIMPLLRVARCGNRSIAPSHELMVRFSMTEVHLSRRVGQSQLRLSYHSDLSAYMHST